MRRSARADRQAAVLLRVRAQAERLSAKAVAKEIRRAAREMSAAHRARRTIDAAHARHRSRLSAILLKHYLPLGMASRDAFAALFPPAQPERKDAAQPRPSEPKPVPAKPAETSPDASRLPDHELRERVAALVALYAAALSAETRRKVEAAIAEGIKRGENSDEIAARIERAAGGQVARSQAQRLARTAVTSISNDATLAAAARASSAPQAVRVKTKQWWTALDNRVRESHREAHGQTVELDDAFEIGISRLRFPGDPWGPPEEVINCRCVLLYGDRARR